MYTKPLAGFVHEPWLPWKPIGKPSTGQAGEITLLLALITLPHGSKCSVPARPDALASAATSP